jgi:DNA-binding response OmpR family regulator
MDDTFAFLGAQVDPAPLEIRFNDGSFEKIGRKEFGILFDFAQNPQLILSRGSIIHSVWGEQANVKSRSLD